MISWFEFSTTPSSIGLVIWFVLPPLPSSQGTGLRILTDDEVDAVVKEIEDEKAAAEAAKRGGAVAAGGSGGSA